jgi:prolyl oligopeptidase
MTARPTVPTAEAGLLEAPRLPLTEHLHRRAIADPYRWLEDTGDPRTARWQAGQRELFAAHRAGWQVERWAARLAALAPADQISTPLPRHGSMFTARHRAGADHPEIVLLDGGTERTLLDPKTLDPAGLTTVEAWRPSWDGRLLAYQLATGGNEDCRLWVLDVATGAIVDGPVDRVRRSRVAWLPGGTHYYYVRHQPPVTDAAPGSAAQPYDRRVCLHEVGTDPNDDIVVFGEGQPRTRFYTVAVTPDGRWLTITAATGTDPSTDVWLADLSASLPHQPALRPVQRNVAARTELRIAPGTGPDDPMFLRTTRDAPLGRVMTVRASALDTPWRELIPERPGAVLADFALLAGTALARPLALVTWIVGATREITVHDLRTGAQVAKVPLPGAGTTGNILIRPEGGHEGWFGYTDHRTAPVVLRYDALTGQTYPWPAGGKAADGISGVRVRQDSFTATDGTQVPIFVLSPDDRPGSPRPTLLTGYGGFGVSMTPAYTPDALAWVQAGGVYAIACLRGGGEYGRAWHEAGRGARKQVTFDDFGAAADYLVAAGWTSADRLGIIGSSNGGLMVGAALTQYPEKFAAAVCRSALLDMVRYENSGLGPSWRSEYGSADDPEQLAVLAAYSPYHHVRPGTCYPPVLLTASAGDSRVDPLHARKMCAALQHVSRVPVLLREENGVGHGQRAESRRVALNADCLAFLAAQLGLAPPGMSTDETDADRDHE